MLLRSQDPNRGAESYSDMKYLLHALCCNLHMRKICDDLKILLMLLGLQERYEEYPSSVCLWDSIADDRHYLQKEWPARSTLKPATCNVKSSSLCDPKSILLPPLHVMHLVKALNKDNPSFKFLHCKFPAVSDAKLGAGMF